MQFTLLCILMEGLIYSLLKKYLIVNWNKKRQLSSIYLFSTAQKPEAQKYKLQEK